MSLVLSARVKKLDSSPSHNPMIIEKKIRQKNERWQRGGEGKMRCEIKDEIKERDRERERERERETE